MCDGNVGLLCFSVCTTRDNFQIDDLYRMACDHRRDHAVVRWEAELIKPEIFNSLHFL